MEIIYTLDNLTPYAVNSKKETLDSEGQLVQTFRKCYVNTAEDRIQLQDELPLAQATAILSVWGVE